MSFEDLFDKYVVPPLIIGFIAFLLAAPFICTPTGESCEEACLQCGQNSSDIENCSTCHNCSAGSEEFGGPSYGAFYGGVAAAV